MPRAFNWSRTQSCEPTRIAFPRDEAEVVALVKGAREGKTLVKVVGARHSWSDIAMTDEVMVCLDRMQDVVSVDLERGTATAQAGVRLHRLNEELAARGGALPIVGSVVEQSLAGVMSTGTHGSSLTHGNISSFVVAMRIVTGTGEVLVLHEGHPLLPAARVGLGAFGIITEVTVRVFPAFKLCERTESVAFDDAVADIETIARSAEYVKLWWLPHTDTVIVFRAERTTDPGKVSAFGRWLDRVIVNGFAFALLLLVGRWLRGLIAPINRLVARTYLRPRRVVGRSDLVLSLAMPPRHREMEYAIPLESTAEALRRARELIESRDLRVNFITEVRFVRGDDAWMSPASERDSCQLGAYMAQADGIEDYFDGFEAAMKDLEGRPHWGKESRCTPEEVATMYPRAPEWLREVRRLDPDGVFANRYLERLFPRA